MVKSTRLQKAQSVADAEASAAAPFSGSDVPTPDAPKAKKVAAAPASKALNPLAAVRSAALKSIGLKQVEESKAGLPFVSSGSITIDDLIGGTLTEDGKSPKCPGYPRRRITEIYGAESSGKTTAAINAIAEIQKNGGTAMFIDFEQSLDQSYARRVGMSFNPDKLGFYQPSTMEEGWKLIHLGIAAGVDLIVLDSVAAMVTEVELNKKPGDPPQIGVVARAMSQMLPKICIWLNSSKFDRNPLGTALIFLNQVRANVNTGGYGGGGGDTDTSTGGKALKFYAYLRIKFTKLRAEKLPAKRKDGFTGKEVTVPYGNLTQVKLVKSKVDGKQGFTSEIFIRFNYGIDNYVSLIEAAVANRIIQKTGSFFKFNDQQFQGREKLRKHLMDNPSLVASLRATVLKVVRAEDREEDPDLGDEDDLLMLTRDEEDDFGTGEAEEVEVEGSETEEAP